MTIETQVMIIWFLIGLNGAVQIIFALAEWRRRPQTQSQSQTMQGPRRDD